LRTLLVLLPSFEAALNPTSVPARTVLAAHRERGRGSEGFEAGLSATQAVASAIRHAAPPITAAGLVLATSFGSLMIYDDQGTKQTGFGMAIGILFASFLVSTLLVPALTALIGKRSWWPSQIAENSAPSKPEALKELRPLAYRE
jgi:RND superfamily putative drug exporter